MSGSGIIGETTSFAAGKHHSKKPDLHKQIRLFCWSRIRESIYIFLRKIKERMPSSRHPAAVHRTAALEWVRLPPPPVPNKNTTRWVVFPFGAGYGSRTRLHGLGSRCITDIRILRVQLTEVIIAEAKGKFNHFLSMKNSFSISSNGCHCEERSDVAISQ